MPATESAEDFHASSKACPDPRAISVKLSLDFALLASIRASAAVLTAAKLPLEIELSVLLSCCAASKPPTVMTSSTTALASIPTLILRLNRRASQIWPTMTPTRASRR